MNQQYIYTEHLLRLKMRECKAGVVLNLTTPVSVLEIFYLNVIWYYVMSINPGFGGQKFEEILTKSKKT